MKWDMSLFYGPWVKNDGTIVNILTITKDQNTKPLEPNEVQKVASLFEWISTMFVFFACSTKGIFVIFGTSITLVKVGCIESCRVAGLTCNQLAMISSPRAFSRMEYTNS